MSIASPQLGHYLDTLNAYNFAPVWNGRGNTLYTMHNFYEALAAYERAHALHPRLRTAWQNTSLVLNQLGRFEDALDAASEAIRLRPDDPYYGLRKADSLKNLHHREEARFAEALYAR